MNAPTTNITTYRTPEGQLIHNVIFSPDTGYYKWKDDQGRPCILKAYRFEAMMTPVLVPAYPDLPLHQQRVIAEKAELDGKIEKLNSFIETNPFFDDLDEDEQCDLGNQRTYMEDYSRVLGLRIARFKPAPFIVDEVIAPTDLPAVTDFLGEPVTVNDGDPGPSLRDEFGDTDAIPMSDSQP